MAHNFSKKFWSTRSPKNQADRGRFSKFFFMDNQNQNMSDTIENISKLNYINEMGEYPTLAGLVRANIERIASEGLA